MADTYTQVHIHFVFAVKNRQCLISKEWKDILHQYIIGIIHQNKHKVLAINSMPDHMHILIGLRGHQSYAALMQEVKGGSSAWINKKGLLDRIFRWQEGYGAFACNGVSVGKVARYIENQEKHHAKKTMTEEYRSFIATFETEIDSRKLFTMD
jgi:putative transposase